MEMKKLLRVQKTPHTTQRSRPPTLSDVTLPYTITPYSENSTLIIHKKK